MIGDTTGNLAPAATIVFAMQSAQALKHGTIDGKRMDLHVLKTPEYDGVEKKQRPLDRMELRYPEGHQTEVAQDEAYLKRLFGDDAVTVAEVEDEHGKSSIIKVRGDAMTYERVERLGASRDIALASSLPPLTGTTMLAPLGDGTSRTSGGLILPAGVREK